MKGESSFTNKIVVSSVVAVTVYTATMVALVIYNIDNHANVWPPAELTALWFAFWTVEIVMLASIRKTKIKNKYERDDSDEKQVDEP